MSELEVGQELEDREVGSRAWRERVRVSRLTPQRLAPLQHTFIPQETPVEGPHIGTSLFPKL